MRMISGLDGVFLHLETPAMPMHVGSLSLLARPPHPRRRFLDDVRRLYARRLPLAPVLSRKLHEFPLGLANPVWVQAPEVDLEHHIRGVTLPSPGTRDQLEACVAGLHSLPLDRTRPLWSVHVIDGLHDGRIGFYTNIHHAVVDGQAGVELMRAVFDLTPHARRPRATATRRPGDRGSPWAGAVIARTVQHDLGQYWKLLQTMPDRARALAAPDAGGEAGHTRTPTFGPRTPLNVAIDGTRGFATASMSLSAVHEVAAAHHATMNDVVLAVCAGALRRYLGRHGGVPREPLVAGMPVSLRLPGKVEFTTLATMVRISLGTDIAEPVRRLHAIHAASAVAKAEVAKTRSFATTDFPTLGVASLLHGLGSLYGKPVVANHVPPVVNVVVSNVPGPPQPLYLAGARVLHHWPISIVGHGLGLNITVESYADSLEFGVTTAAAAVPRPRSIADGLLVAFEQLRRRSG
jgi:diacylglycerol O-acyltransferase / wax synthase